MDHPVNPKVIFRVDATPAVALGHLKRCLALAVQLKETGVSSLFVIARDKYAAQLVDIAGFPCISIDMPTNTPTDRAFLEQMSRQSESSIVVIDSYDIDNHYRQKLMDVGLFIVSITDSPYTDISSHVLINANLGAEKLTYDVSHDTKLLAGIKYLILGKEFWSNSRNATADIGKIRNVLITMGGIDHYDLTTTILKLLEADPHSFSITAIVGPYYENKSSIYSQVRRMRKQVRVVENPKTLYTWMTQCSLALSAGGQTLYELAVLGRPTIGLGLWKNQEGNVSVLSSLGAIKPVMYRNEKSFIWELKTTIDGLLMNSDERRQLSIRASAVVDGQGARRVAYAILENYKSFLTKRH